MSISGDRPTIEPLTPAAPHDWAYDNPGADTDSSEELRDDVYTLLDAHMLIEREK
jgi:hypothetical protein